MKKVNRISTIEYVYNGDYELIMDVSKYVHQCIQMDDFFPTKGNFPALFLSVTEQKQWSTAEDGSYKYKSRSKRD